MGLKVMPAGEEDIARSIAIEKAAYGPNPISHIIFPGPPQPNADTAREQHMIEMRREDPEACQWIQAVDDERVAQGKHGMVSFCMGYLWRGTPKPPPARVWGPGTNPEACDAFFGGMNRIWEENMGSRPHFYLKLLHTDPEHQRRGAGSMLLQHYADQADRLGLDSYLEATDDGRPLYEKFGYEVVGMHVTDFSKWDGPAKFENPLMLRRPKTAAN